MATTKTVHRMVIEALADGELDEAMSAEAYRFVLREALTALHAAHKASLIQRRRIEALTAEVRQLRERHRGAA